MPMKFLLVWRLEVMQDTKFTDSLMSFHDLISNGKMRPVSFKSEKCHQYYLKNIHEIIRVFSCKLWQRRDRCGSLNSRNSCVKVSNDRMNYCSLILMIWDQFPWYCAICCCESLRCGRMPTGGLIDAAFRYSAQQFSTSTIQTWKFPWLCSSFGQVRKHKIKE